MTSANVGIVQGLYDAFSRGDAPAAMAAMSPDIVWVEAESFPYDDGNPYIGPDAVAAGVFARLGSEWDGFSLTVEAIHDAGDTIISRGRYTGAYKATGKPINAQFAHVWRISDGKLVAFQQYADTAQVVRAMQA
jgi:uncharacterized protein